MLVGNPARIQSTIHEPVAHQHPDAPKQFGVRLCDEILEMVSKIQEYRKNHNQPSTLSAIVEDAIEEMYDCLVESGDLKEDE